MLGRNLVECSAFERFSVYGVSQQKEREGLTLSFFLVETVELESTTPCMSSKYSNQLSYASITERSTIIAQPTGFVNPVFIFFLNFRKLSPQTFFWYHFEPLKRRIASAQRVN